MVLVLALSSAVPAVRQWRLLYGYITIVVVLNEKVLFLPQPGAVSVVVLSVKERV